MHKKPFYIVSSLLLVLLLLVLSFVSFYYDSRFETKEQNMLLTAQNNPVDTNGFVQIGGRKIKVDVVDNVAERTLGLSGRKSLAADEGMLFVFENSGNFGFWMKDMNFPIDIIWIDEGKSVVHLEKNVSPDTYPTVFTPSKSAKYVLEVQAGFSDATGLKPGDNLEF